MPRKKKTTNKRPVLNVPSLLTNEAFALREARLAAVRDQINQKVCSQGLCVLCLQEARLTRSHLSSNSLLRGYYGHTWESVFLWHGEHRSSTDAFSYLLFCTPCEQRFMEDDVIAYLGQKLGLGTDGCPDVPNEACIWHWAFTLFMRQLAVCEDRGAHAWVETIYRRSVHFALLCKGNGNAHHELDNLPAIVVALSQPDQDLWQELELEHRKLLDERASRRQAGWLMLNVEVRCLLSLFSGLSSFWQAIALTLTVSCLTLPMSCNLFFGAGPQGAFLHPRRLHGIPPGRPSRVPA